MAPADKSEDLVFYPAFCFKASPTHFTWVKLAGVDVHQLKRRKEFEGMRFPTLSWDRIYTDNHMQPRAHSST
jgi:hypothetical protein